MEELKYPVGMQSFPEIRERGFVYVDKTQYIPMIMDLGKYFFLGRPRRFGKSLFLSTLHAYFDGRKELFEGLAISEIEDDWIPSPVLHIDFTGTDYTVEDSLKEAFESILNRWEKIYYITEKEKNQELRFQKVISTAYEKTGRKVVILMGHNKNWGKL